MKHAKLLTLTGLLTLTAPAYAFLNEDVNVKLRPIAGGKLEILSDKSTRDVPGGVDTELTLKGPALVTLENRIPMVLIPVLPGTTDLALNPPAVKEVVAAPRQREVGDAISEIMMGITSIQKSVQRSDVDAASAKLDDLRKRFPEVRFLDFVSGSVLLLKGEKEAARKAVQRGLEAHPDYRDGQEFLKALGGGGEKGSRK